jgi:hypothetical protein
MKLSATVEEGIADIEPRLGRRCHNPSSRSHGQGPFLDWSRYPSMGRDAQVTESR